MYTIQIVSFSLTIRIINSLILLSSFKNYHSKCSKQVVSICFQLIKLGCKDPSSTPFQVKFNRIKIFKTDHRISSKECLSTNKYRKSFLSSMKEFLFNSNIRLKKFKKNSKSSKKTN